ncbi:UNVERIFIED_CONTAM: hypothetical protein FKN15_048705 [Acipenser sinensis]
MVVKVVVVVRKVVKVKKAAGDPPLLAEKAAGGPLLAAKAAGLPPLLAAKAAGAPPLLAAKAAGLPPLLAAKAAGLPPLLAAKAAGLPPLHILFLDTTYPYSRCYNCSYLKSFSSTYGQYALAPKEVNFVVTPQFPKKRQVIKSAHPFKVEISKTQAKFQETIGLILRKMKVSFCPVGTTNSFTLINQYREETILPCAKKDHNERYTDRKPTFFRDRDQNLRMMR